MGRTVRVGVGGGLKRTGQAKNKVLWLKNYSKTSRHLFFPCKKIGFLNIKKNQVHPCPRLQRKIIIKCSKIQSIYHTSIHWPCYCLVHIFVVIQFCDSICSFCVEVNLCMFFLSFVYIHWRWRYSYQEWGIIILLTSLTPPHCCVCSNWSQGLCFQRQM